MQLQFIYPWALYLLWTVPALGFAWLTARRRGEQKLDKLFSPAMRVKLCPRASSSRFFWQWGLVMAGLFLSIIAAARPQWGTREQRALQRGRDLVIALDVSRSMLARDVRPNRLLRAKADIMDLLRELRGDRVALVAFRHKAVQICPLTIDYSFVEQALDGVIIDSAPPGATDIGDGIAKAMEAFETGDSAHKAIILVSDGEDLTERVKAAAEQARSRGIPIFTVGLGDPDGATIPDPAGRPMTHQGREVVTRLDHESLREIAELSGGAYVPVGTANVKLGKLYRDHLSRISARDIEELSLERHVDRYQWFLLPAIVFFLAAAALSRGQPAAGRRKRERTTVIGTAAGLSGRTAAALLLAASLIVAGRAEAGGAPAGTVTATNAPAAPVPPGRDGAQLAQRLFRKGDYKQAAEAYMQAAREGSFRLQNTLLFNAACALHEAGDYAAAAEQFQSLMQKEEADLAAAAYNLGCSLHELALSPPAEGEPEYSPARLDMLEKSGRAFQDALRFAPGSADSEVNLSITAAKLPGMREQVKIQELLARHGGSQPFQLTDEMLKSQRAINDELALALANPDPTRIRQLEELGARQKENADLLIPLKPALMSASGTDASDPAAGQQLAMLNQHIEAVRNAMRQSAEQMRDLQASAPGPATASEAGIYRMWKATAPHGPLLTEDIRRQTAALALTTNNLDLADAEMLKRSRMEQDEAVELTDLFTARFTEAFPPSAPDQAGQPDDTEGEAEAQLSAETRERILELAAQASGEQKRSSDLLQLGKPADSVDAQQKSLELLEEIQKLLPKDENKQQDQQQDQQKQDQQDQQQQDQQQDGEPQEKEDQQDEESAEPERPEEEPAPEPEPDDSEQEEQESSAADDDGMTPEQARALLEKAKQRERDHQREKMQRTHIPPSPSDKDW